MFLAKTYSKYSDELIADLIREVNTLRNGKYPVVFFDSEPGIKPKQVMVVIGIEQAYKLGIADCTPDNPCENHPVQ